MTKFKTFFRSESNIRRAMLLLFLIVYHLTMLYSLQSEPVLLRDSEEYIYSSQSFDRDNSFYSGNPNEEKDYRLFSKRTPFYPLVLYSFSVFNIHLNMVYILQIFIALLSILLLLVLVRQFEIKHKMAYVYITLFILFTPSQFIYSQFIMADIWLQLFIMGTVLSLIYLFKTRSEFWLIVVIVTSTIAALTKPVFLPATFFISGLCAYLILKYKFKKVYLFLILVPLLSWAVVSNQNKRRSGVFEYSSIGSINLLHYNANLFLQKKKGTEHASNLLGPLMIIPHSKEKYIQNTKSIFSVCNKAIASDFPSYLLFHLKGIAYFFLDPGRYDIYNFLRIEEKESDGFLHNKTGISKVKDMFRERPFIVLFLGLLLFINVLKTFGFIGFFWLKRKNAYTWICAVTVLYIAVLTGPLGASRFALPVELIIIGFAALFFASLKLKGKQNA